MVEFKNYSFNPKIKKTVIDNTRFIDMLPSNPRVRTEALTNFSKCSIEHLLTSGDAVSLDGYIGDVPSWNNPNTDYYIPEINSRRQFYQLSASMVCYDSSSNSYNSVLNYPDYIDSLGVQGSLIYDENRLFTEEVYTWCPSIDLDKFVNHRLYYWLSDNSNPTDPDYIVIEKNSMDGNPWSTGNNWIHIDDYNDNISSYSNYTITKSERPIIEFFKNIELYDYGVYRRKNINFVYNGSYSSIKGQTSIVVDGITINSSTIASYGGKVSILITGDTNTLYNNKVYVLFFQEGVLALSIESDGINPSGSPHSGEIIYIEDGASFSGKELHYDGTSWVASQRKTGVNQPPLFQLYDVDGISLNDETKYPNSNFAGNQLFGFNNEGTVKDSVLGIYLTYDVYGQIQFRNFLVRDTYQYYINLLPYDITGSYFFNIFTPLTLDTNLNNSWYDYPEKTTQYIIDNHTADGINFIFDVSVDPNNNGVLDLEITLTRSDDSSSTSNILENTVDYLYLNKQVLIPSVIKGDQLRFRSNTSNIINSSISGFYELPVNITANPNNIDVTLASTGDLYDQFISVIENQSGFSGSTSGSNNYRNTSKSPIYGNHIIQNKNDALLSMLLSSTQSFNLLTCVDYCKEQYRLFRNKFEKKITEFFNKSSLKKDATNLDTWVTTALKDISRGYDKTSPFFNSGVGRLSSTEPEWFIPPTPSFLGLYDISIPGIVYDSSVNNSFIRCHDTSLIPVYGDFRDSVILTLENRIYNSIKPKFTASGYILAGNYRDSMKEYSNDEWNSLLRPFFETWASKNNLDYKTNSTYVDNNPFTWNWSSVTDYDGNFLPGSTRGIYKKYYGTYTPNTTPWEMLGFYNQPEWWETQYGPYPYTSNNEMMWRDISKGIIAVDGTSSGYSYPDLLKYIPVDAQGYLKDPYQIGIAKNYPNAVDRNSDWVFGDISPIEYSWRISSEYGFSMIEANYLAKPAKVTSECWDSFDTETILAGTISEQKINPSYNRRIGYSDYLIHNELIDGAYIQKFGLQQFVSYYLMSQNLNITTSFADFVRDLDVRLSYKMAGYTDQSQITLMSDTSDIIPNENFHVMLYRSPFIREFYYSGLVIVKDTHGYRVYGYNSSNPKFKVLSLDTEAGYQVISVAATSRHQILGWKSSLYYPKGSVVTFDSKYWIAISDVYPTVTFDSSDWKQVERPNITSTSDVIWYNNIDIDNTLSDVPYGTLFKTNQDLVNFINGYQKYLEQSGFIFDTVIDTNQISDFRYSIKTFLNWVNSGIDNNDFLVVSPSNQEVDYTSNNGEVYNLISTVNSSYGIVDKFGKNISPLNISITRDNGSVKLIPLNNEEIYGTRMSIFETEHVLIVDNKTVFNDILYDPIFNIRQDRFKITGFKTSNWDGRYNAPGFIITGNTITPNYETTASNFRKYFDTSYSFENNLQEMAWGNTGFHTDDDLTALSMSKTSQFDFYRGSIQNKGTVTVFDRLMNSKAVSNKSAIKFYEEWAFRIGDYSGVDVNQSFDVIIEKTEFKSDPQLIEFDTVSFNETLNYDDTYTLSGFGSVSKQFDTTNSASSSLSSIRCIVSGNNISGTITITDNNGNNLIKNLDVSESNDFYIEFKDDILDISEYIIDYDVNNLTLEVIAVISLEPSSSLIDNTSSNSIKIVDIVSSTSNSVLYKDPSWKWRLFGKEVSWSTEYYDQIQKGFFPNAGYVKIDTVDYFVSDTTDFNTKYFDVLNDNNSVTSTNEVDFNVSEIDSNQVMVKNFTSAQNSGWYRVNSVNVEVVQPFSVPVVVNIGRQDQLPDGINSTYDSNAILRITYEELQEVGSTLYYPSEMWNLSSISDNTIKAQFCYGDLASSSSNTSVGIKDQICYDKIVVIDSSSTSNRTGSLKITINCELIVNSMTPNERIWLYKNDANTWQTMKLQYDGDKIDTIYTPSYDGQGSIVSLVSNNNFSNFNSSDPVIISGSQNIEPEISQNAYPNKTGSVSVTVDSSTSNEQILMMLSKPMMNITSFVVNITEPFISTAGDTVSFNIGTATNENMMAQSSVISNPSPSVPSFNVSDPITVSIPNQNISVFSDSSTVSVDIIRSGNIYGLPNTCSSLPITSATWDVYPVDVNGNYVDTSNNSSTTKTIIQSGTVTFGSPQSTTDTALSYWDQKAIIELNGTYSYLMIEITGVSNGSIDSSSMKSFISIVDDTNNSSQNYLDPTVPGASYLDVGYLNLNYDDDYIVVSVVNASSGSATITVTYQYLNGFELFDVNSKPMVIDTEGNGGNIFRFLNTRFSTVNDAESTLGFVSGDIVEVDNNDSWKIMEFNGSNWEVLYEKTPKIIVDNFKEAILYNENSNLEEVSQIYDPYKGAIPKSYRDNIDYFQDYDPAKYNSSSNTGIDSTKDIYWDDSHIGKIWWDMSTVRYLDYENFDDSYKINHWGELLPNSSVDVYQWVKSPVDPSQWNAYIDDETYYDGFDQNPSGTVPSDLTSFQWVTASKNNPITDELMTIYYFWVLNPNTVMNGTTKTISCYGLSSGLSDIKNSGVSYYSVISPNKMLLGGLKNYTDNTSTSLKVNWVTDNSDIQSHKEWVILRNGDPSQVINLSLWNKMKASLVGWNIFDNDIESTTTLSVDLMPQASKISISNFDGIVDLPDYGYVRVGSYWFEYHSKTGNNLNIDSNTFGKIDAGTLVSFYFVKSNMIAVPDQKLTSYEQNGNLIRPSQSWFPVESKISSRYARKLFVQEFNNLMASETILDNWANWQSIFNTGESQPDSYLYKVTADDYDYMVTLAETKTLSLGERVLLPTGDNSYGFWLLYEYNPFSYYSDSNGFVLVDTQKWRMQDGELWSSVDWYQTGYSIEDIPLYTFDTQADMMANISQIDPTLLDGSLIQLNTQNASDQRWSWVIYDGYTFVQVAKEKATIKLSDAFWKNKIQYRITDFNILDINDRDGSLELNFLLTKLYDNLMSGQMKNDLFFTMVKASISLNKEIDWVVKTSFLYFGGYTDTLSQTPVAFVSHLDNIVNYIQGVKPYHVTIRDYVRAVSYGPDIVNALVTDFDFPVYTDTSNNTSRRLNPVVKSPLNHNSTGSNIDAIIANSSIEWSEWYQNYLNSNLDYLNYDSNYNPVRRKYITIQFNRVETYTDDEIQNLPDALRRDSEFKGTVIKSPNIESGVFDLFPWDYYGGWSNELGYYAGDADPRSPISSNPDAQPEGETPPLDVDNTRRDIDLIGGDISQDNYEPDSIEVNGNQFIQPFIDENHPGELMPLDFGEAFIITSTMIDTSKNVTQRYMQMKDDIDTWEVINGIDSGTLVSDNETTIQFNVGNMTLHDPNNPSKEMLDKIKLGLQNINMTQDQINQIMGHQFPGVIILNGEKIIYWNISTSSGVATISNLQRTVNGLGKSKSPEAGDIIYDASILSWATMDNLKMIQRKKHHPIFDYKLSNNIWTLGTLNICYKTK